MKYKVEGSVEELCKSFFYLAYQACGGTTGMGSFQARESVTPDEVWKNVQTNGDYMGDNTDAAEPYGDYVFGRMMKLGIDIEGDVVTVTDSKARADYQGWACEYPTYQALLEAAAEDAGVTITEVQTAEQGV